jgi:vacuolar-type H+-ATPase subunit E/Vma4
MAIQEILKALEEQGEAEARDILDAATEQAHGIDEDAKAQAARIRKWTVEAARAHVQSRTTHIVNAARLDARRIVAAVKEKAIAEANEEALAQFESVRSSPGYAAVFRSLAVEALAGLEGEVTLIVNPADEQLADKALAAAGLPGAVQTDETTSGGLTVVANAGTLFRRNTLEDRLEKFREIGRAAVAEILFA